MSALPIRRCAALQIVSSLGVVLVCLAPARADAQGAATLYERALDREQAARSSESASLDAIRAIARSYEVIVRRYPGSGYSDNALWQAAGLMKLAYSRSGASADREAAERFLVWLRREYPTSSLVSNVDQRLAELGSSAPKDTPARTTAPTTAPGAETAPPVAAPPVTAPPAGGAAVIQNITESLLPRGERLTIELSREVIYAGQRVDGPDRVFVDFTNATAAAALAQRAKELTGTLIKGVRVGRHSNTITRVVLELNGTPRYSTFPLFNPFRLVVDVENDASAPPPKPAPTPAVTIADERRTETPPKTEPAPPAAAKPNGPAATTATRPVEPPARTPEPSVSQLPVSPKPAPPAITSRGDYSLARQLGLGVARIVIDAGHGGHDPGAQANGINEAELVLDVAQRVEKLLVQHDGVDVVLTRRTDEFIPLEERTAIANRGAADLFLSIHANASPRADARGVETYFLNFATNPEAEKVAARENATSAQTMGTLPAILKAIALNNKLDESRELASIVQTQLVRKLRTQNKTVRDLGVKQAPFVVLIGAQMPSILAEISFITNRSDATLLKQAAYRQQIAQALYDGVIKYQASLKKVTTTGQQR
jgi:N-acetylmuramoyl-L-alanine amidase